MEEPCLPLTSFSPLAPSLSFFSQATGDASAPDRAMATSEKFLSELVAYHPSKEDMDEKANCPVCIQDFTTDEKMHVLPCFHTFHPDCCIPWLKKHNTCPVCRHELPSDDPGWDARKQQQQAEADKDSDLSQLHDSMFG